MQLTVDTSWWTRYRSRNKNPDLCDTFPQAIPSLAVGQHPAIPRTDNDGNDANFFQAIANTAGFHFAFIEQGGTSLYPQLAQRVSNVEALRILLSIGGVEIAHFQTWQDKGGNAPQLADVADPVTGVKVTFPDLNSPPLAERTFKPIGLCQSQPYSLADSCRRAPSFAQPKQRQPQWEPYRVLPAMDSSSGNQPPFSDSCAISRKLRTPLDAR